MEFSEIQSFSLQRCNKSDFCNCAIPPAGRSCFVLCLVLQSNVFLGGCEYSMFLLLIDSVAGPVQQTLVGGNCRLF